MKEEGWFIGRYEVFIVVIYCFGIRLVGYIV